jgi:3-deoxy-D-manno-octulosonate 8-phosphate phosphatase (KDO 8-P phosphatase)
LADRGRRRTPAELAGLLGPDRFVAPPDEVVARLGRCRALVLDWDGVLGTGARGPEVALGFNELDAMGINLLRFALWRRGGERAVPTVAVVSGQGNAAAQALAERDRLDALYMGFLDKRVALEHLCRTFGLRPEELMFVFDDAIDLSMAERCGARFLVARPAQPLLERYVVGRGLCDYVVRAPGGAGAVREACEVALGLLGMDEEVFEARGWYAEGYQRYLEARRGVAPVQRFAVAPDPATGRDAVRPVG